MEEVFSPFFGFKVVSGPPRTPKRLNLLISPTGIKHVYTRWMMKHEDFYPLEQVSAEVRDGRLVLQLGDQVFTIKVRRPERYVKKLEEVRASCVICGARKDTVACSQCGRRACRKHSNVVNGQVYCVRCKVVCPRCLSEQITAQERGFSLGRAAVGAAVGGIVLGGLAGAAGSKNTVLVCLSCGHRWQPGQ